METISKELETFFKHWPMSPSFPSSTTCRVNIQFSCWSSTVIWLLGPSNPVGSRYVIFAARSLSITLLRHSNHRFSWEQPSPQPPPPQRFPGNSAPAAVLQQLFQNDGQRRNNTMLSVKEICKISWRPHSQVRGICLSMLVDIFCWDY